METTPAKIDLYSLLGLTSSATIQQIVFCFLILKKQSFKKLVLLVHPDKNPNDPNAAEKFRSLNQAYKILSDPEKRKLYDETGEYDENEVGNINDTYEYYREIYPRLTLEDINKYAKTYKNSKDELSDLIDYYNDNEGNLIHILESIPLSENRDIERFIKIYENLIKEGKIEKFSAFNKTKNKIEFVGENPEEQKEAEEQIDELTKQIQGKRKNNDFLDSLARKYGGNLDEKDIDDKEFEETQKKMMEKNQKKKIHKKKKMK